MRVYMKILDIMTTKVLMKQPAGETMVTEMILGTDIIGIGIMNLKDIVKEIKTGTMIGKIETGDRYTGFFGMAVILDR